MINPAVYSTKCWASEVSIRKLVKIWKIYIECFVTLGKTNNCRNHLYFGDCLDVLRDLKENYSQPFIDLIYIDPPFNSKHNYNVLFESMDMKDANAQKQAFADTWTSVAYMDELHMLAEMHKDLYEVLTTFGKAKSISHSAVEYLTTTALQILYMHKLLKDTGSFKGEKISDTWVDIPQMATKEFLGYPTQNQKL